MKVLFDLVHPAHALFFYNTIRALKLNGDQVCIASRDKDVLLEVLDGLGLGHVSLTSARKGLFGLGTELVQRDLRLWRLARRFRPDVMAGFGGINISHVGKVLGVPSISFYDTEHARLQLAVTLPFISEWHVPESWAGPEAPGRTFRFPRCKQFAYFHPDYFRPDDAIARSAGWDESRDNFLVRTVAWNANHDAGRSGISPAQLRELVARLALRGKVHISSEGALPADLESMRYRGPPTALHHLMGKCRLYCGESITMAVEATAMGVPALIQIDKDYCYITEQQEAGLAWRFGAEDDVGVAIEQALSISQRVFRERARNFAGSAGDLNQYVMDALCRAAGESRRDVRSLLADELSPPRLGKK